MLPGNVVIGGDLGVKGEMTDDPGEGGEPQPRFRLIEQSRPQTAREWEENS